ncbi:FAD-binding protein [Vibrio fluvialis]|nr:FAD-binding protein [Vibrio fluvialis]
MNQNLIFQNLKNYLSEIGVIFKENLDMSYHTYTKVGGKCLVYIMPDSRDKLIKSIKYIKSLGINYSIIGETSNTIFLDDVVYGVVLSTKLISEIKLDDDKVSVNAGNNLSDFLRVLYSKEIAGFEGLEGIPGSVGGAVFMNAGAYGYQISDHIETVECIDRQGNIKVLTKEQCEFSQRKSIFRKDRGLIITSIIFNIEKGSIEDIYKKVERFHIARHSYQEFVLPNAGSIFTAPECIYEEFSKINNKYRIIYKLLKKIFYNKFFRMLRYRTPNRIILNNLTIKTFGLEAYENCISVKHINMFANRNVSSWEMVGYINKIKGILGDSVALENEVIVDSIVDWNGKKLKN